MTKLPYEGVLFDLDGTLTQSEEGIMNCVAYAAEKMGFPVPDESVRRKFIGPPLLHSFEKLMGMTPEESQRATDAYRERYTTVGLFENRVYAGIPALLKALKSRGVYLAVATAKPLEPSLRILEHFRLAQYFDAIVGPDMSVKHAEKDELIRKARGDFKGKCAMVGDRCFDVEGANRVGVDSVGVGYGYGDEAELRQAGCTHYAATVEDLYALLCPGVEKQGWFITMEGGDGCGKTTQARLLRENLERFGYDVYATREPGGCPISEKIRNILLDVENMEMAPVTEAILYAASRAQHVSQVIRPKVKEGKLVLCDRFVDSSVAYQGGGRQLGVEKIMQINAPAVDGCMPDMTVYLSMDHKQALMRRLNASEPDRLEMESVAFHGRIHEAYEVLIKKEPERFVIVDASKTIDEVAGEALEKVLERLG